MATSRQPWWVIGSAAVALHLGGGVTVRDLDILAYPDDAATVLRLAGQDVRAGESDGRFRSTVFGAIDLPWMTLELMGGLEVFGPNGWSPIAPATRVFVDVGTASVPVLAQTELIAILNAFGRPQDLARAALLQAT